MTPQLNRGSAAPWAGSVSGTPRKIEVAIVAGMVLALLLVRSAFAQGSSENMFSVSQEKMLAGVDASTIRELNAASTSIQRNPHDVSALVTRGALSLKIAAHSLYSYQWVHFAAKDLEQALRLDPNNFYARHNYAMACYQAGDTGDDQPVMHLAVTHFTKAIQLKPDSARTYMGRGWAYLMLNDYAHAQADFQKTLQLDPSLRDQLNRHAAAITQKRAQLGCVKGMLQRMGAYIVDRNARTSEQCSAARGYWTNSECRISTAMAPGPLMLDAQNSATGNAGLGGNCAPPPDAVNYRYSPRAGGYVVR